MYIKYLFTPALKIKIKIPQWEFKWKSNSAFHLYIGYTQHGMEYFEQHSHIDQPIDYYCNIFSSHRVIYISDNFHIIIFVTNNKVASITPSKTTTNYNFGRKLLSPKTNPMTIVNNLLRYNNNNNHHSNKNHIFTNSVIAKQRNVM